MGSQYDDFGSLLSGGFSTGDPLSTMFGGIPDIGMGSQQGTSGSGLELAPLYSSQRHNTGGRDTQYPYGENNFFGDYEEEQETYSNVDASGFHVGVRMSRTHQTPFGPARSNVGMQMSVGQNGVTMSSTRRSSFGFGGGGMLMLSFGGRPNHQCLGHRRSDPMGSFLSPFGGLFSPFTGLFPPMGNDPSLFGVGRQTGTSSVYQEENVRSDGPIIEEIIDEDESTSLQNEYAVNMEGKEEEIDASLGLGLLPDMDSSNDRYQSQSVQNGGEFRNNGILNEFAFSEDTQNTRKGGNIIGGKDKERKNRRNKNKNGRKRPQVRDTREEDMIISEPATIVNTDYELRDQPSHTCYGSENTNHDIEYLHSENVIDDNKSRSRQKFSKQEFRNIPLPLNDDFNSLPFLRSPVIEERCHENSRLESLINDSPVNTQSRKKVNKNSCVRVRRDSSESTASMQGKEINDESSESCDITTDVLNIQSFPTKHASDSNSVATHRETTEMVSRKDSLLENSNDDLTQKPTVSVCGSPQSPEESSNISEKLRHDDDEHVFPFSFKEVMAEKNDGIIFDTKVSLTECRKSDEQKVFKREAK
ncbi:uncharacterized protein LOC132747596 [Ruditapes philippinarum]|uniref:uncharacterized protein LOC132747596 n=1 Tax=Ruditapes philippinarum TaxID=129788 RepID=UPI00295B02F1|nr:uncharacterized protein LOC132747596 [Ruditapes philippinarum]